MWLSRVRFTVGRLMILVAFSAVAMFLLMALPEMAWGGHASVPLEFLILDAPTGRPIAGVSIRLAEGHPEYTASTGPDGRAKLVVVAHTGGRSSLLRSTRSVDYEWALLVSAEGYRGVYEALRNHTRGPRYHSDEVPPPIVIRLLPEPKKS